MRKLILIALFLALASEDVLGNICEIKGNVCLYKGVTLNEDDPLPSNENYTAKITHVKFTNSIIHSIPPEIFDYFENLTQLDVRNLKIQLIRPNTFKNAKNLLILDLSYNEIKDLNEDTFLGAEKLEQLMLGKNLFGDKIDGVFDVLAPSLKLLSLHTNEITVLQENIFAKLIHLDDIGLDVNRLQDLPANLFQHNLMLKSIWLNENHLRNIPQQMFSHLVHLNLLRLAENMCINKDYPTGAHKLIIEIEKKLLRCSSDVHPSEDLLIGFRELEGKISKNLENFEQSIANKLNEFDTKLKNQADAIQKMGQDIETLKRRN